MKAGDLIWYNCAGSKQTAIVLGFSKNMWLDHARETEMVKIIWVGGTGPRPAMYGLDGMRLYNSDITRKPECFECYVRVKSRTGFSIFKIISEA